MKKNWFLGTIIAAFVIAGCVHRSLSAADLTELHRIAVVVKAAPGPTAAVAKRDPQDPEKGRQLQEKLALQIKPFELEERIRGALLSKLPRSSPWSNTMSAAEVATALQTLLVYSSESETDYDALVKSGADSVMELVISEWGVIQSEKTVFYLRGQGQMLRLPGRSKIWSTSLDTEWKDDSTRAQVLMEHEFREVVITAVNQLTERLAQELAGQTNCKEQVLTNKP